MIFLSSSFHAKEDEQQVVSTMSEQSATSHKRKRLRKPDTNVLSVKFNQLLQPGYFEELENFK